MKSLKKVLKKKKYQKIKLKKMITNHLEVKAEINGIKGRFILDTGASNSCVSFDLKEHFKIISEKSEIKAAGAGSIDIETQKSHNNSLKIGKWKTRNCDLVVFDLSYVNTALTQQNAKEIQGIIGADILETGKALIDYDKKHLYLKKQKNSKVIKLPF